MNKLHIVGLGGAIQNIQRAFICGVAYAFGTSVPLFEAPLPWLLTAGIWCVTCRTLTLSRPWGRRCHLIDSQGWNYLVYELFKTKMSLCREDTEFRHFWDCSLLEFLGSHMCCLQVQPKTDVCQFFRSTKAFRTNLIFPYYKLFLAPE